MFREFQKCRRLRLSALLKMRVSIKLTACFGGHLSLACRLPIKFYGYQTQTNISRFDLSGLQQRIIMPRLCQTNRCFFRPVMEMTRGHHGHEVDFVVPVGEKLRLIECKWKETLDSGARAFHEIESLVGPKGVLSKTIITAARGHRTIKGTAFDDCVDLASLG